jgi:Arc/MetJ family transcription regulator
LIHIKYKIEIHQKRLNMRTNIVIEDNIMQAAMQAGGFRTKKDAVEAGLQLIARRAVYERIRALRGKVSWTEDDEFSSSIPITHTVQEDERAIEKYKGVRP